MSAPIDRQLRDYTEFFESQLPAIDLEDVLTERIGTAPVRPIRARHVQRRRPWLVAVAAAAAVLILVGGVALLMRVTGSDTPVATTLPTDPTPTTLAEPALTNEWSRVSGSVLGDGQMRSVSVGGPGFVGVGSTAAGDEHGDAAVWTSVDGITWTRVPDDDAVFGDGAMSSVTVGGPGLVAVGSSVWTSVDGITWNRLPHDDEVFGADDNHWMASVTTGGPGLVAVGTDGPLDAWHDAVAAVWTSPDGITWSRVPHDETVFPRGGEDSSLMSSVIAAGPGLVAVGSDSMGAAVWTSVDGVTWSRVANHEGVFGGVGFQGMISVTVGGPGLVAVGFDQPGDDASSGPGRGAAVWTSVDGITWFRVPHDEAVFGGTSNQMMTGVTAAGQGIVAVGSDGSYYGEGGDAAVWTSVDGITWFRVPHDETVFGGTQMGGVTVGGPGVVAVGGGFEGEPEDADKAMVWVASKED